MPVLLIYGIPEGTSQEKLGDFIDFMRDSISSIKALKIKKEQVSVFLPKDHASQGLGEEIIIFVDGLFERPERTEEVRNSIAENLVAEAHEHFPQTPFIECMIRSFNPAQGSAVGRLSAKGKFSIEPRDQKKVVKKTKSRSAPVRPSVRDESKQHEKYPWNGVT